MLKIGKIYEPYMYIEKRPRPLAAMFFNKIKFFEGI